MASFAAKARTASAAALFAKRQQDLDAARALVKERQSLLFVAGQLLPKAKVAEEKERVAALNPSLVARSTKATPTKTTAKSKAVSAKVAAKCVPFKPAKRGRPTDGMCNFCKWRLAGLKGGKAHTCGKIPYTRIGEAMRV